MKNLKYLVFIFLMVFAISCQKEDRLEQPTTNLASDENFDPNVQTFTPRKSGSNQDLKMVSFNTHGASKSELETFRDSYLASDAHVICLQEVSNMNDVRNVFSVGNESGGGYPYMKYVQNYTKEIWVSYFPFRDRKRNHVVILSKFPICAWDIQWIQTDPGGDNWRRNAVYVKLKVNSTSNSTVDVFGYHNTYNWGNNSSSSEKSGMTKFKNYVEGKVGSLSNANNVFLIGDFNLGLSSTKNILGSSLNYKYDWVDYVVSTNVSINSSGTYNTAPSISDHDAPWAAFSLTANTSKALSAVVRLYEHSNFGGDIASFEVGNYSYIGDPHKPIWNDRVSSVKVGYLVKLSAWEHSNYGGKVYYWPQINNSGTLHGLGMNDKISSLKVQLR